MIQPKVDMLLQYFGREVDELVRAKEEYFLQTGGEVARRRSLLRAAHAGVLQLVPVRSAPGGRFHSMERFLREKGGELPGKDKDVLIGFTQSRVGLYEYRGTRASSPVRPRGRSGCATRSRATTST